MGDKGFDGAAIGIGTGLSAVCDGDAVANGSARALVAGMAEVDEQLSLVAKICVCAVVL